MTLITRLDAWGRMGGIGSRRELVGEVRMTGGVVDHLLESELPKIKIKMYITS